MNPPEHLSPQPARANGPAHKHVEEITQLRVLVATLGESASPPWWKTTFLSEAGLRLTGRIFPRSYLSAAVNAVSQVARRDHDERIGKGRRYHLFRLQPPLERSIQTALTEPAMIERLRAVLALGQEGLLEELSKLVGTARVKGREGPALMGPVRALWESGGVGELAAMYRSAFREKTVVHPYYEE